MSETKNYLIDMDGVLVRGMQVIPGAADFIDRLKTRGAKFLVLTNNPIFTPGDLAHRLHIIGLPIEPHQIFTSAMATAKFLHSQKPRGTAFVIGEAGLTEAIHQTGYVITDHHPDYFVLGETLSYNFEIVTKAIRLVTEGAHFIATNPDPAGPSEGGVVPACGAMAALIESASGYRPFFIGKPNPLMMRTALNHLGVHSENTVMIGDRMDTDVISGVQAGMETVLVLSGMTRREDIEKYPWQPTRVVQSLDEVEP